jgi:hypothetical protein
MVAYVEGRFSRYAPLTTITPATYAKALSLKTFVTFASSVVINTGRLVPVMSFVTFRFKQ